MTLLSREKLQAAERGCSEGERGKRWEMSTRESGVRRETSILSSCDFLRRNSTQVTPDAIDFFIQRHLLLS